MEEINYKGYKIKIEPDENPESPREWDNLGVMVCFHKGYNLGDKQNEYDHNAFESWDQLKDEIIYREDTALILPLYLYDHSGISISVGSFIGRAQHAEWDSGLVGFIYATKEAVKKEYGVKRLTKKILEQAEKLLRGEVETYDQFLTGDVYGYIVEKDNKHLDSCWGFYGEDTAIEEAKGVIEWYVKHEPKAKDKTLYRFNI